MRAHEQIVYTCKIHSYESGELQAQLWSRACLGLESPQLVASVVSPNTGHSGLAGLLGLVDRAKEKRKGSPTKSVQSRSRQLLLKEGPCNCSLISTNNKETLPTCESTAP